jgi:hypothetical protein
MDVAPYYWLVLDRFMLVSCKVMICYLLSKVRLRGSNGGCFIFVGFRHRVAVGGLNWLPLLLDEKIL